MYVCMYTVLWTQKQANDEAGLQYIHVCVAQGCICSPMTVLTVVHACKTMHMYVCACVVSVCVCAHV